MSNVLIGGIKMPALGSVETIAGDLVLAPFTNVVDAGASRITNILDATLDNDAVALLQMNTAIAQAIDGLASKQPVKVATDGTNEVLSPAPATINGISITTGDSVLLKDQTAPAENGIYIVEAGNLVRRSDANTSDKLVNAFVFVQEGTNVADFGFVCTNDSGFVLDTDPVEFVLRASTTVAPATDTTFGTVRLATSAEVTAGTGIGIPSVTDVSTLISNATTPHVETINFADLTGGSVTVTHNRNTLYPIVTAWFGSEVVNINVTSSDANSSVVDLSSFGDFTGTTFNVKFL